MPLAALVYGCFCSSSWTALHCTLLLTHWSCPLENCQTSCAIPRDKLKLSGSRLSHMNAYAALTLPLCCVPTCQQQGDYVACVGLFFLQERGSYITRATDNKTYTSQQLASLRAIGNQTASSLLLQDLPYRAVCLHQVMHPSPGLDEP